MKKKTGMTIVELLVSITMLIVATGIMYGLMINLQNKKKEVDAKTSDLITITDIEKTFQDIVMGPCDYGRENATSIFVSKTDSSTNKKRYQISYKKNGTTQTFKFSIDDNKKVFLKDSSDNIIRQWSLNQECENGPYKMGNGANKLYYIFIKCGDNHIKLPMFFNE